MPEADHKGRVKLGVIVGHDKKSKGAALHKSFGYVREYDYNTKIANKIKAIAEDKFSNIGVEIIFRDGVGISGAYRIADKLKCDAVIELHFNGFNGKAFGTSTLCTAKSDDVAFATVVHKAMCKVFGRKGMSRGLKVLSRSDRGGGNVHAFPNGANCLVEPFFGDNELDAKMGVEKMDEYALSLLEAVQLWARQVDMI